MTVLQPNAAGGFVFKDPNPDQAQTPGSTSLCLIINLRRMCREGCPSLLQHQMKQTRPSQFAFRAIEHPPTAQTYRCFSLQLPPVLIYSHFHWPLVIQFRLYLCPAVSQYCPAHSERLRCRSRKLDHAHRRMSQKIPCNATRTLRFYGGTQATCFPITLPNTFPPSTGRYLPVSHPSGACSKKSESSAAGTLPGRPRTTEPRFRSAQRITSRCGPQQMVWASLRRCSISLPVPKFECWLLVAPTTQAAMPK
jgi:hypothetical protein